MFFGVGDDSCFKRRSVSLHNIGQGGGRLTQPFCPRRRIIEWCINLNNRIAFYSDSKLRRMLVPLAWIEPDASRTGKPD
ncbi:hypothetical protein V1478_001326 [Vespula squamosa]|uniref:Uncharacterized protein n=1 Tax=Vespula squamosa TaxID=30214 RepID=A0ABD2C1N8_VESSQ